jgi:transposase
MEPIQRIKKIKGIEYWYGETPYYDPVSKQTRYKNSTYLGRNIDGKPVRMRSAPAEVTAKVRKEKKTVTIRSSYDYGSVLILKHIMQELKLDQYLHGLLNDTEVAMVTALAFNRVLRPLAMQHVDTWYTGTVLPLDDPKISLTGQRISELLERIGTSNIPQQLMGKLLEENQTKRTLIYDITSISSYSSLMHLLEYGYNRDGLSLPQINLSLIMDKDLGIPVMYDIYPGSISDVTTLTGTLMKLEAYGVEHYFAIMDRGFFSQNNLIEMLDKRISFIIAATFKLKDLKMLLTETQRDIENVDYLQKFKEHTIYVKPVTFPIGSHVLQGYLYYDPKRERDEKEALTSRLFDIREELADIRLKKGQLAHIRFFEKAGKLKRFFDWKQVDNRIEATIKQNAVAQRTNLMGKFILFHSGDVDWMTCLSLYRERDEIEKEIEMMKSDLDALPLNTHSDSTMSGFLFIVFLGLIIRSRLLRMMTDAGLLKRYAIKGMLLELEKFRKISLADGRIMNTEMTKKQRLILEALNLMCLTSSGA